MTAAESYVLCRQTLRGEGYSHLMVSNFERLPPTDERALYRKPATDHTEKMAVVVMELEAALEWRRSRKLKQLQTAFDVADWDRINVYKELLTRRDVDIAALDLAIDGLRTIGYTDAAPVITEDYLNAAAKILSVMQDYKAGDVLPHEDLVRITAVVFKHLDDVDTIIDFLSTRREYTAYERLPGMLPMIRETVGSLRIGIL